MRTRCDDVRTKIVYFTSGIEIYKTPFQFFIPYLQQIQMKCLSTQTCSPKFCYFQNFSNQSPHFWPSVTKIPEVYQFLYEKFYYLKILSVLFFYGASFCHMEPSTGEFIRMCFWNTLMPIRAIIVANLHPVRLKKSLVKYAFSAVYTKMNVNLSLICMSTKYWKMCSYKLERNESVFN